MRGLGGGSGSGKVAEEGGGGRAADTLLLLNYSLDDCSTLHFSAVCCNLFCTVCCVVGCG